MSKSRRSASRTSLHLLAALLSAMWVAGPDADGSAPDAIARLKAGNARFVADAAAGLPVTTDRRAALARGQTPYASVLSCADSRVPPEVVFNAGLGDLFVVRAAGHVPDRSVLASLEYGAEHLRTPLVVVMGHEMCGAVRAAIEMPSGTSLGPNLDYLLKSIRPALARAPSAPADARLRAAILANVEETINQLLDASAVLRRLADTQKLTLIGAYYELASGRAHFSEPVVVPPSRSSSSAASHTIPGAAPRPAAPAPAAARPAAPTAPSASAPAAKTPAAPTRAPAASAPAPKPAPAKGQ